MMIRTVLLALAFLIAVPAAAQNFPPLTGRVVDQANLLNPQQEAELTTKLEALERASTRQLVVVTIPSLEGYEIADYGYRLGRHWNIGQRTANNGVLLIVALSDRKIRIEVGYGLEGILTDALSNQIISNEMRPRFRDNDYPGGINAGADAIIAQLQAPPEAAEARVRAAATTANRSSDNAGGIITLIFWFIVIAFVVISMIARRGGRGRKYRGRRGPVIIWGPGLGNSGSSGWSSGSSWGSGGGSSWGGGGGGFSGGGGSFGGGGASGGW